MAKPAGVSTLAGSFPADSPGLPRGRGRMSAEQVRAVQRSRILRAAIGAFAEVGFHAATVADIVTRARVSRSAFYQQFADKEECFLAAIESGQNSLMPRIATVATTPQPGGLAGLVRATVREYLRVCADEPEFTRAWTLEFPTAGPRAMRRRHAFFDALAGFVRTAHVAIRPDASLPETSYLAMIGGCHELFYRHVSDGRAEDLPDLEDPIVLILLTWLE